MELAPPATLSRLFVERAVGLVFSVAVAWAGSIVIDLLADRWQARLDPRMQAVRYSVLPLGRQVFKILLTSGYAGAEPEARSARAEFPFIAKPYRAPALGRKLKEDSG